MTLTKERENIYSQQNNVQMYGSKGIHSEKTEPLPPQDIIFPQTYSTSLTVLP